MITITTDATNKIKEALAEIDTPYLRIAVQGGGCSGFQYSFTVDDSKADDDFEVGQVLIDSMSMMYLAGATLKYTEDMMGSQFTIDNPNAQTTCGCGSSFGV